ncbi:oligosaccharide flippase family protein [Bacteroides caccae]|jgi:O-antigen/teichoic acid export membrane protein|uniref:lipopolysaccharide biosynthesis protein n=1 Tax=Bacteroides caccae TaxID=47678 RepID=UPI000EFE0F27|nr:oligosaccharide flippase family protein [Bacteroides caccae]RHG52408.1 lipopolysaccharide biosynthesis protein [Bacteroides caccae]WOG10354.1 oligosaccharide flippase family protein [Bacteroides caccae]
MSKQTKSLAKNTIFLYLRMIVVLTVSLFTTRIILRNLGVEDYGIYNVVGSIVSLFSFLQTAMSSANYRYLAFAIGKEDRVELLAVFKSAFIISLFIALVILLIGESFGVFYIYNYLNVPWDRFEASCIVYQISLVSCIIQTITMIYYSDVIAHEHMRFFAYLSFLESLLKISIALLIAFSPIDKLILYSSFILASNIIILILYYIYCRKHFFETEHLLSGKITPKLLKEMMSFSSWTLFVTLADICVTAGLNMLINSFFSAIVNAARGVATQVQGAVDQFRGNLQTALNPQITKQYAAENRDYMYKLMYASSKFSTYILLLISLPIMFSADYILNLWLVEVPPFTSVFLIYILVACIIDGISNPFVTAVGATGKIQKFQTIVGIVKLLIIPVCYLFLHEGCGPETLFLIYTIGTVLVVGVRIYMGAQMVNLSMLKIFVNIFRPVLLVTISCVILVYGISFLQNNTLGNFLMYCILSVFAMGGAIFLIGMNVDEKKYLIGIIYNKILKK